MATGRVPVTPVVKGSPVAFVRIAPDGVPKAGVVKVGDVARAMPPDPVTASPRAVPTPAPRPPRFAAVYPVQFVRTPDAGVPSAAVTSVGELSVAVPRVGLVPKTSEPDPVSSVTAVARLALDGVERNAATPAPRPEIPVDTGSPVALVRTAADGVPRAGVTRVGEVAKTLAPVPVSSVRSAARLPLVGVPRNVAAPAAKPDTPVEIGRPVALVSVPLAGVPSAGVTSVGDVARTTAPEPVTPLDRLDAAGCAEDGVPSVAMALIH